MRSVSFSLSSRLGLGGAEATFVKRDKSGEIFVFGDLMGLIRDDEIFGPEQAFELMCKERGKLAALMRVVVGPCVVVLKQKNRVRVFASPSCPGLYYWKRSGSLHFSSDEDAVYANAKKGDIDEDQLFNALFSNTLSVRSPFKSLFKSIGRCPCAGVLSIDSRLRVKSGIYNLRSSEELEAGAAGVNFEADLKRFSFLMEGTLRLIEEYYEGQDVVLSKSGGVDSSVLLAGLIHNGLPFRAYHVPYHGPKDLTVKLATLITEDLGVDLSITNRKKPELNSLKKRAQTGLGVIHGASFFDFNHDILDKKSKAAVVDLVGQNADSLYAIDTFAPSSIYTDFKRWLPLLKGLRKRVYYSDLFLRPGKAPFWLRLWPFCVSKAKKSASFEQYLKSTVTPAGEHVIPLHEVEAKGMPVWLYKKNKAIKMDSLYEPILGEVVKKYGSLSKVARDTRVKNHVIRVFRWFRTIQNAPSNYHNTGRVDGVQRLVPYSEGPISDFYLNMLLNLKDVFFVKRLSYAYFKQVTGRSYFSFTKRLYLPFLVRLLRLPFLYLKRLFVKEGPSVTLQQFERALPVLKQMIPVQERYLSSFFKNDALAKYVANLYERFEVQDAKKLSKADVAMLCRLVNTELLLRSALAE